MANKYFAINFLHLFDELIIHYNVLWLFAIICIAIFNPFWPFCYSSRWNAVTFGQLPAKGRGNIYERIAASNDLLDSTAASGRNVGYLQRLQNKWNISKIFRVRIFESISSEFYSDSNGHWNFSNRFYLF